MNADRLFALYDRVAEAPDAVGRLRRFVLDLAVRGKLVEQNPADEPASELLKQIAAEKARLVGVGDIRKRRASTSIDEAEIPFEAPVQWAWIRLHDIGTLAGGMTPSKNRPEYWNGDVTWLSPKDIKADAVSDSKLKITKKGLLDTRLVLYPAGSLFIVARSGILRRTFPVAINRVPAASNQDLKVLVPFLKGQERYLQIMFRGLTTFILKNLVKTGTTVQSLKYREFEVQPVPLPPLAEQHRIVAKVDELMALCDQLEEARTAREDTRDRMTKTSLTRLFEPDIDALTFRSHARFAVDALPALTARADQVKHLRQTILNLAVRGKLAEQDPTDEPASELLERIAEVRVRLGVKQEMKPLSANETPFHLPVGWHWSRIGELCTKTGSGSTPRGGKSVYKKTGVPFLRSQNVYDDGLRLADVACIGGDVHARMARTTVQARDLLLNITGGSMGRCCRVPDDFAEANVSQHVAIIRPAVSEMADYLHMLVLSPYFQAFIFREQTGAGRGGLPKNRMDRIAVAVPPFAEQHRIVAKVDELMALCDRIEAGLATVDDTCSCLLDSLLHDALASSAHVPVVTRRFEA